MHVSAEHPLFGGHSSRSNFRYGSAAAVPVELRGAGTDESPNCYKRLPNVLAEHAASVRILHTLTPLGVAMAGENEEDPYKD